MNSVVNLVRVRPHASRTRHPTLAPPTLDPGDATKQPGMLDEVMLLARAEDMTETMQLFCRMPTRKGRSPCPTRCFESS